MTARHFIAILLMSVLFPAVGAAQDADIALTGESIICPDETATITFTQNYIVAEAEVEQAAADAFMAQCPNVTVEFLDLPESASERLDLYREVWAERDPTYDVIRTDVIWARIIAPHVVDLGDYIPFQALDQFYPSMLNGQTVEGKLVALPYYADIAGLYYRRDLLEAYGLEVPQTWDELTETAQLIQENVRQETGNEDFWGYVWQGANYEGLTCDAHEWLTAATGNTFITPSGDINVTDPAFYRALDRARSWIGTISPPEVLTYHEELSRVHFMAGDAAFMRNWPYVLSALDANPELKTYVGWAPLPTGEAAAKSCLGGWQLAVSAYSDHPEAAAAFAVYLASYEVQRASVLNSQNLPTRFDVYTDPDVTETFSELNLREIAPTAHARPSAVLGDDYDTGSRLFATAVHSVLSGEAEIEAAMTQLEADLEALMMASGG